jgi:hypothetical protein
MKTPLQAGRWLRPVMSAVLACAAGAAAATPPVTAAAQAAPAHNAKLSAAIYGVTHIDPSASDAIPYAVARGEYAVDLRQLRPVAGGPINIMTYAATVPGFMWSVSSDRVAYIDARDGGWKSVAELALPGITRRSPEQLRRLIETRYTDVAQAEAVLKEVLGPVPGALMPAGVYSLVDADNLVWANAGTWINAIGLKDPARPEAGLEMKRRFDLSAVFEPDQLGPQSFISVIGLNMSWDGQLIVAATNALAVIDPQLQRAPQVHRFPAGQFMTNSLAVDERNGIYIATGHKQARQPGLMMKLVWTGSRISTAEADGAWQVDYEGGDWPPAIKAGTGTGATPTLMGFGPGEDRLVLITDGRNRMNLLAFWRDQIPADFKGLPGAGSRRLASTLPITAGRSADTPWLQSEQSVVVSGRGAFVVNNVVADGHRDKVIDAFTLGPVQRPPHGVERAEWDPASRSLRSVWSRGDVVSVSMVPIVSSASNIVFVNGYTAEQGWEVTGLDWLSGKTVFRTLFGPGNEGNGAYAILQFMPDGDLLFNSVGGPYRVPLARPHPAVKKLAEPQSKLQPKR